MLRWCCIVILLCIVDRQRHSYGVDDQLCESLFKSYVEENMSTFPLAIGKYQYIVQLQQNN